MLFETLNQGLIFLTCVYFGIICGIGFEIKNIIEKTFKNNKVICFIIDFCFMVFSALLFIITKNTANFGEVRLYLLFGFILGAILEHISIGYLVEKIILLLYNFFVKVYKRVYNKIKQSKLIGKLKQNKLLLKLKNFKISRRLKKQYARKE